MEYLKPPFVVSIKRLWWQKQGLQQTATGYGRKLRTEYMVQLAGSKREHRVYATCYSNVASYWIVLNGREVWIHDSDLEDGRDKARR